ncbi:GGDEF domain-containing protein [Alkalimarinus sediminis]|uniref:diguanylate cyclase n=1 Tax=Alkalimarinus sediminis TaxID=1632866 RepID=A0A9E8HIX1_9ALTE|nr:GGDEF domain-containing protein [Alkalimarinus sediminis]UZW73546.1 GGDEF domain-containing protein [Alkalimarinus sediminis]
MTVIKYLWKLVPFSIVVCAYLLLQFEWTKQWTSSIHSSLPYLMSAMLLLVSLIFNRSRLALGAINACLAYAFIQNGMQKPFSESSTQLLFIGTAILFSWHLCLTGFYRERGSISSWGVSRLLVIIGSYFALWVIVRDGYLDALHPFIEPYLYTHGSQRAWLGLALLISQFGSGLLLLALTLWKRTSTETALLAAWLTGNAIFYDFAMSGISTTLFTALLLALFISLIQSAYDLAFVDALTLLPGRRALDEKMGTLTKHYTIAMLDVDHFKKFNDTYGHDTGDQVLRLVASKIRKIGSGGVAYRYGGEEFAILFPKRSAELVEPALNKLKDTISSYRMTLRNKERTSSKKLGEKLRGVVAPRQKNVNITVSIGVAQKNDTHHSAEDVIKDADEALYRAKNAGRNRVVIKTS